MTVTSGTMDTRTEHREAGAALNLAFAVAIPLVLSLTGLAVRGFDAVSWPGALIWGFLGSAAFAGVLGSMERAGVTHLDWFDVLGSLFARARSPEARRIGMVAHFSVGLLLSIGWAYTCALFRVPATWVSGLIWGLGLFFLTSLLLTSIGAFHPAMRRGEAPDPGPAAANLGGLTTMGLLVAHLAYGILLGGLYRVAPL
jgi:hypothetical protein